MVAQKHTDEELVAAVEEHGSQDKAAKALGINRRTMQRRLAKMKQRGAHPVENSDHVRVWDDFKVARRSQYYDAEGNPANKWIITTPDREAQAEAMEAAIKALAQDIPNYEPTATPEKHDNDDKLCNLYTLTDAHIGALAWHKEGGEDWDLRIQEDTLVGCFRMMIEKSPKAEKCVINQCGDWLHFDGLDAVTPTSGNLLDADGRFGKVVETSIRILRRVVKIALANHRKVVLVCAEGNHDLASSVWLRKLFVALYEDEPRLEVIDSELPYYVHKHGKTMLAFHHGHLAKNANLPLLFASEFSDIWGKTKKRYCHTGHRHHLETKEHSGMTVTQHPTLAARDAHASRHGYSSDRHAISITYHVDHGMVGSNSVTPEMLK